MQATTPTTTTTYVRRQTDDAFQRALVTVVLAGVFLGGADDQVVALMVNLDLLGSERGGGRS